MNCTQFERMLDDYLDGELSTIQLSHCQAHLNECEHCRHSYTQANKLINALKEIPVPAAKDGYEKRVLSFLDNKSKEKKQQHNWFIAGFGSAVAASFALWLVLAPVSVTTNTETMTTVSLPVQQPQTVDLVFNLQNDLTDATLTIELPENVIIAGYENKRQLSWTTSLKKGTNRLALPLIAKNYFDGILVARLSKKGKTKSFSVHLNSSLPSSGLFEDEQKTRTNA